MCSYASRKPSKDYFDSRHIGPNDKDLEEMLGFLGPLRVICRPTVNAYD